MKYEKPGVVALAAAAASIQGSKGASESLDMATEYTIGAYEADE